MHINGKHITLGGKDTWRGADLAKHEHWISRYSEAALTEVDNFVKWADNRFESHLDIERQHLDLPLLQAKFEQARDNLENGYGFTVLRGLPVAKYTESQNRKLFWALALLVGNPERQDKAGNRLHSIRDKGKDLKTDPSARGYETNNELTFHNDGGDAFMLLCLKTAISGGTSKLASVNFIYNEVVRRDPKLAAVLQQDFHFDAREQHVRGLKVQTLPIFNFHKGKLSALYKRSYILTAQRFEDVPRLTQEQIDAIALVEEITNDSKTHLSFQMEPGDIQLGNNYSVLHSRTSYVDHEKLEDKRHNLRAWLTIPGGRALPAVFADTREFSQSYASRTHD